MVEYGGLVTVVDQVRGLGQDLWFWVGHPGREELLIGGALLTGFVVLLRLVRAR